MLPKDTPRLRFREMTPQDIDLMAGLLGDPDVMTYYPAPKTRDEAAKWIAWNEANYAKYGYGLWIVETHDGEFLGDCGLTWQKINGESTELEVGYHVRTDRQGAGYATEAAAACRDFARDTLKSAPSGSHHPPGKHGLTQGGGEARHAALWTRIMAGRFRSAP